jgi:branched-chain amino acid transport system substrate-binding protein
MKSAKRMLSISVALAVVAIVVLGPVRTDAQTQKDPIIFAVIDPISGPFKEVGMEGVWQVEYVIDQINAKGGLLGRPVKLMKYDDQMKPDVAVRVARKAAEDGAKVILQQTSSAIALALSKMAKELNVVHITMNAEADEITGQEFQPNTFRVGLSTSMHSAILAQHFAQTQFKRYYLLNMDYAFGHAVADSFKKEFGELKKPGMEIVGEDYHPMATKDFGPYVTKAVAAKPDVIVTGNFGPDLTGFIKQARALGLKATIGSYYLDNVNWCEQLGDAALGTITGGIYLATIPTKTNQAFAKSWQGWFKEHYPSEPVHYTVPNTAWNVGQAALFVAEAIKKAGSTDADKIIAAWEGLSYEGVGGKMTMRACDHQTQADGWIATIKPDHSFRSITKAPFLSEATKVPVEKISVAPKETGNPRCK